jgi:gliding motility-associated-like protein
VTNTGNVTLTNITISDPLPGVELTGGPISLDVGESDSSSFVATYTLTQDDVNSGSVSNQAIVFGTAPDGTEVQDLSDDSGIDGDSVTVTNLSGCVIEVFNAVSPNNDGDNDVFLVRGLECYPKNRVEIYNRWGVLVFERDQYNNADRAFRGISEGRVTVNKSEELPEGTYYYVLKYEDFNGSNHEKAGYLYINRK